MYPEDFDFPNGCPMCRFFPPPPPQGGMGGPPPPPPPGGMGGMQGSGPPSGPPPAYTPHKTQAKSMHAQGQGPGVMAVDAGSIRFCRFRYTYIWLENGRSFWIYPVYVGRTSISGWRWNGRFWVFFGIDLRRIDSFLCY